MKKRTRVRVENPEAQHPVIVRESDGEHALSLAQAEALLKELSHSVEIVKSWFQCWHTEEWECTHTIHRCWARGSVKINGQYYCKRHAKKAIKEAPLLNLPEAQA